MPSHDFLLDEALIERLRDGGGLGEVLAGMRAEIAAIPDLKERVAKSRLLELAVAKALAAEDWASRTGFMLRIDPGNADAEPPSPRRDMPDALQVTSDRIADWLLGHLDPQHARLFLAVMIQTDGSLSQAVDVMGQLFPSDVEEVEARLPSRKLPLPPMPERREMEPLSFGLSKKGGYRFGLNLTPVTETDRQASYLRSISVSPLRFPKRDNPLRRMLVLDAEGRRGREGSVRILLKMASGDRLRLSIDRFDLDVPLTPPETVMVWDDGVVDQVEWTSSADAFPHATTRIHPCSGTLCLMLADFIGHDVNQRLVFLR